MRAVATHLVSILRGSATDPYGDVVDSEVPAYSGVRAAIFETNRRVFLPAEAAYRIIRTYSGRVGPETDIRKDDRIRDERTGTVYLVTDISDPISPAGRPDIVLQLSRTT